MYCVKCGVELADSEVKCPLCLTPVYYPEHKRGELTFPKFEKQREEVTTRGMYFIITILFVIAAAISVICDISLNYEISWSAYVLGGLLLVYSIFIMPGWFVCPSPAIFVPSSFAVRLHDTKVEAMTSVKSSATIREILFFLFIQILY